LNVQRTIKQLIASGAKGAFIEDQEWPKKPGHIMSKKVIPMEEVRLRGSLLDLAFGERSPEIQIPSFRSLQVKLLQRVKRLEKQTFS
jgi:hypothetical protein